MSVSPPYDEVLSVLSDTGFWQKLKKCVDKHRASPDAARCLDGVPFDDAGGIARGIVDKEIVFVQSELWDTLREFVISQLSPPPILTDIDIHEVIFSQVCGIPTSEWEKPASRVAGLLYLELGLHHDDQDIEPEQFDLGFWFATDERGSGIGKALWRSRSSLQFCVYGEATGQLGEGKILKLRGGFDGWISGRAQSVVERHFREAHQSIMKTVRIVCKSQLKNWAKGPAEIDVGDWLRDLYVSRYPVVDDLVSDTSAYFVQQLIDCLFRSPTSSKKRAASLDQRLRNAVYLLIDADKQNSPAIALSLCCSAMEALVCTGKDGIADELSRRISILLQPDPILRQDAIKGIKQLYSRRSEALHGAFLTDDDSSFASARRLAAAVLRAVVEWKYHAERIGDTPERTSLLDVLQSLSYSGQQLVGIETDLSSLIPVPR